MTWQELSEQVGYAASTLSRWKKEDPQGTPPKSDIDGWRAYAERLQAKSGRSTGRRADEVGSELRKQLTAAQAKGQEIKNERDEYRLRLETGELMTRRDHLKAISGTLTVVAERIRNMPDSLAVKCNPADHATAREALTQFQRNILTDIQSELTRLAENQANEDTDATA